MDYFMQILTSLDSLIILSEDVSFAYRKNKIR